VAIARQVAGRLPSGTLDSHYKALFINVKTGFGYFLVNLMTATLPCGLRGILFMFPTEFSTGNVEKKSQNSVQTICIPV
jgi:hypothetical protein